MVMLVYQNLTNIQPKVPKIKVLSLSVSVITVKILKFLVTRKIAVIILKICMMWLYHRVMSPKDADGMANSVDPDQTAPLGAV